MNNPYVSGQFQDLFVKQFLRVGKIYWWFLPILNAGNVHGFA